MSNTYRLVETPVTVKTSPVERLPSPSESVSARVPFAKVPRIPLARETFVNTAIPFSRSDARKVRFMASSGLQNGKFAVACHGFVPWVVNVSVGTRPVGSPWPTTQTMSPTLVLPWARFRITEVRFDRPAARNTSRESSHVRLRRREEAADDELIRVPRGRRTRGGQVDVQTVAVVHESIPVRVHEPKRAVS